MPNTRNCKFAFDGPEKARCATHPYEVLNLTLENRSAVLRDLVDNGKWTGPPLDLPLVKEKPLRTVPKEERIPVETKTEERTYQLPPVQPQGNVPAKTGVNVDEVVEWQTTFGERIQMTVRMFKALLCPQANDDESVYFLQWCHHNGIDPFQREATFSIMKEREKDKDGKPIEPPNWIRRPTIMVARDAWVKRAHESPVLESYEYGIIVEASLKNIRDAIIGGFGDTYCLPDPIKNALLQSALDGKAAIPTGLPDRLQVRKRGQFLNVGETLKGGWFLPHRKDGKVSRPWEVNLEGWSGPSHFWKEKAPFMIAGAALRNGIRHELPHLAKLIALTSEKEEIIDGAAAADIELQIIQDSTDLLKKRLFVLGKEVPAPVGPLRYKELHALAVFNYDGRGISELSHTELADLLGVIQQAANGNENVLNAIQSDLQEETNGTPTTNDDPGTIQDAEVID